MQHQLENSDSLTTKQQQDDLRQAQEENKEIYRYIPVAQLAHLA